MRRHTYTFVITLLLSRHLIIKPMDIPSWKRELNNAETALQHLEVRANGSINHMSKSKQLLEIEVYEIKVMQKFITDLTQNAKKNNYTPDQNDLYQVNQSVIHLTLSLNQTINKIQILNKK